MDAAHDAARDRRDELAPLPPGRAVAGLARPAGQLDGAATPASAVDAWLLTDARAELAADIRRRCRTLGLRPHAGDWTGDHATVRALPVAHTSHPTVGYLIQAAGRRAVWAPEYWQFPDWTAGTDLMFADAAGWDRPIRSPTAPATTPASWTPPSRPATTRSSG